MMLDVKLRAGRPRQLQKLAGVLLHWCNVRDGHLLWTGELTGGLPVMGLNGARRLVRRVAWESMMGYPVGNRAVVVTCGQALCIRPDHLRATGRYVDPADAR